MKFNINRLNAKVNLIILLFVVIVIAGITYVLSGFSLSVIYQQISTLVIVLLVWIASIVLIKRIYNTYIGHPIKKIEQVSRQASTGDLSSKAGYKSDDELGSISDSIDSIIQNQSDLAEFVEKIGDGNYNIEYAILGEKDKLGYSINSMRDKLHRLASEDARRKWSTEGIAKFGAILREDTDDLKVVCDKLLSNLVIYLEANQGAIFLLNEENNERAFLEMVSAYAWERKKYITKTIEIGEGLVGQVAIEKGTIYLTDVPENYVSITSGLGDANPRSILIVPLLFDDELFGVMEFASFKVYQNFEVEFVEKVGEILASTISRANINKQTQKLLRDSQKLTEELRTQEEEMRQNLEEMNATQEELQQREVERIGIFTAINNTLGTVEFNMEGRINDANEKYLSMMNYSLDDIENKTDRIFADKANEPIELFNKFWQELGKGMPQRGDFKRVTKGGREIWITASYTPALDKHGKPYKVIELAQDITEKKKAELELQRQAEELRSQGEKLKTYTSELEDIKQNLSEKLNEASKGLIKKIQDIETEKAKNMAVLEGCVDGVISFNQNGNIEYFNQAAEEIWSVQRASVIGKPISTILPIELAAKDNTINAYYSGNGTSKEIHVRTEISFTDVNGNTIDLLATLTKARVENETTFTIFAQKISVDLF
jgi:PAS domain S-box-containing protein